MIKEIIKKLEIRKIKFESLTFLAGDASPRKYYSILQGHMNNVLMLDNDLKNMDNFIYLTKKLKNHVSVPKIIYNLRDSGILILENFNSNKYGELLSSSNRNYLYKNAIDALIYMHKKKLQIKLCSYDLVTFFKESNLFFDWYIDKYRKKYAEEKKSFFNNIFKNFLEKTNRIPNVFVHRDYHIDNLFLLENKKKHFKCGWIDYQDALYGPCVYDLVSIIQDARINVEKELEDYLINYYLDEFKFINRYDFFFSYRVIAIQRHLKVLGIFSRLSKRDKKSNYKKHIPRVLRLLKNNLEYSEFDSLKKILIPMLEKQND